MNAQPPDRSETFVCPGWMVYSFDNVLRRVVHRPEKLLGELVRPGFHCLDVGCGIGYFTIPLARLAGKIGNVTAVDIQQEMLGGVSRRAQRAGLQDRITVHLAAADGLNLKGSFDFILAFWMVHEVPDQRKFLAELRGVLEENGRFLLVEPLVHVSKREFTASVDLATREGFGVLSRPGVALSRAVLLG